MILRATGKPDTLIKPVTGLRPGHDQRYAVDTQKIRALGWRPELELEAGIAEDRRLVRRESRLVGADQVRRVPRVLPEALRAGGPLIRAARASSS